jgi:hypothetical protein
VRPRKRLARDPQRSPKHATDQPRRLCHRQDRERAPALGRAALSIPHLLFVIFYPNLLSLTTISPLPSLSSLPLSLVNIPSFGPVSTRLVYEFSCNKRLPAACREACFRKPRFPPLLARVNSFLLPTRSHPSGIANPFSDPILPTFELTRRPPFGAVLQYRQHTTKSLDGTGAVAGIRHRTTVGLRARCRPMILM